MLYTHRLEANLMNDPKWVSEFLKYIDENPNCCQEVWLCSSYGFPPIERHRDLALGMKPHIEQFKKRGIKVALQISNTMGGHNSAIYRNCTGLIRDDWHAPFCIDINGNEVFGRFCPRSEEFKEYIDREFEAYLTTLEVSGVWIDDDFKMGNHNLVCWCDSCIEEFSRRVNRSFTREELIRLVNDDLDVRDAWIEFTGDRMYETAKFYGDTVHKYNPDAYIALEHGANGYMQGLGHKSIFKGFMDGTGIPPKSRPGAGAYEDYDPNTFIEKYRMNSHQTRYLPDFVEDIRPEVENIPDVCYGKTMGGIAFETAFYFAAGATSINYATMMRRFEPLSWLSLQLKDMTQNYDWLTRLANINRETNPDGVEIYIPEKPWSYKTENDFEWEKVNFDAGIEPIRHGFGINFHKTDGVLFLNKHYAKALSDSEIEMLLSKNVVCDGESATILTNRGFGDALGLKSEDVFVGRCHEVLPCGNVWQFNFFFPNGSLLTLSSRAQEISEYQYFETGERFGTASAYTVTEKGGRWAVIGYGLFMQITSFAKRCAIVDAIEWAGGQLSAKLTTRDRAIIFPRKDKATGRLRAVSIVNTSIAKSNGMELQLKGDYKECEWRALYQPAVSVKTSFKNGSTYVTIPTLDGWGIGTLFLN
ncbi:MAG: hypothetical protein IJP16_07025 [Clostridia bacterium]|nr:hypothetical protein [Clostridia bacterium]